MSQFQQFGQMLPPAWLQAGSPSSATVCHLCQALEHSLPLTPAETSCCVSVCRRGICAGNTSLFLSVSKTGLWPRDPRWFLKSTVPRPTRTHSILHLGGLRLAQKPWVAVRRLTHLVWLVFASPSHPELLLLSDLVEGNSPPTWGQVWGTLRGGRCPGGGAAQLRAPAASVLAGGVAWPRAHARCALTVGVALPLLLYSEQLYDINGLSSELGSWTRMSASCHCPGQHTSHTSVWEAAQDVFPLAELRRPRHSGAQ